VIDILELVAARRQEKKRKEAEASEGAPATVMA